MMTFLPPPPSQPSNIPYGFPPMAYHPLSTKNAGYQQYPTQYQQYSHHHQAPSVLYGEQQWYPEYGGDQLRQRQSQNFSGAYGQRPQQPRQNIPPPQMGYPYGYSPQQTVRPFQSTPTPFFSSDLFLFFFFSFPSLFSSSSSVLIGYELAKFVTLW